ncbi:MAG TPA: hypothetical protein VHN37_12145 [Actinomycetota bacterium]|nr:hypothetical protein [Actinomycetota bacterium]
MSAESKNVSGQAYSLTVMAPISPGRSSELAAHLDDLGSGDDSPLAKVPSTHFARWVVLDALIYEGGRQRHDSWSGPRLLFTSNFDGPLDAYLEGLRTGLGAAGDAIWEHCTDYPGHRDAGAFNRWMRARQLTSSLFFAAYGDQTVQQVLDNLRVRQWLTELALKGQALDDAELQDRFLREYPR